MNENHICPICGGELVSEALMNEKKDACYYKVKSRYKVWPSAYASGALVKCRKKGAKNWGTKSEGFEEVDEACWKGYHKEGNKKMFGKTYPNCVKNTNEEQQCPECGGELVSEEMINEKKDACYYKVKSRYKVWPSAYASGALVKCRKVGAANWGNKSEETHPVLNGKNGEEQRYCPLCQKRETRSECSYGEKAWDRVSVKDEEYSMARSELSTIVDAVKRLQMKATKGVRWMPWHQEATKDVVGCDKLRGAA